MVSRKEFVTIAKLTLHEYNRDDVGLLAAGVSLFAFFSLFPALLLAVTFAGLYMDPADATTFIYTTIAQYAPGSTELLQEALNDAIANRENAGWLALIGLVTLVFSASSAFSTLDKAVNRAWNSEKVPSFLVGRLVSFVMMAVAAILLLLSVLASTLMTAARAATTAAFGEVPGSAIFWWLVNVALSLALIFVIFVLVYRFLPRFEVVLKDVWLGALLAAIAWVILKELFALYLGASLIDYGATYGNIGTVIILLTWIYLSALIILTGAEFTAETYKVRRLRAEMTLQRHSRHEDHGEHQERVERVEGGEARPRESPWFSTR